MDESDCMTYWIVRQYTSRDSTDTPPIELSQSEEDGILRICKHILTSNGYKLYTTESNQLKVIYYDCDTAIVSSSIATSITIASHILATKAQME